MSIVPDTLAAYDARLAEVGLTLFEPRPGATEPSYPYVVRHVDGAPPESDRIADVRVAGTATIRSRVIGTTERQVIAARARLVDAFADKYLPISGRRSRKTEYGAGDSQPAYYDDSVPTKPLWVATDQMRFYSEPTN